MHKHVLDRPGATPRHTLRRMMAVRRSNLPKTMTLKSQRVSRLRQGPSRVQQFMRIAHASQDRSHLI